MFKNVEVQKLVERMGGGNPVGEMYYNDANEDRVRFFKAVSDKDEKALDTFRYFKKSLTAETVASGKEFIPTEWSSDIIRMVYENSPYRQLFRTISMNAIDTKVPAFIERWTATYTASSLMTVSDRTNRSIKNYEQEDTAGSTGDRTLSLKTITINIPIDDKYDAFNVNDQIVEIIRADMISAMLETESDMFLNGDTASASNINNENGATNATKPTRAFDGLRKLASGTSVAGAGAKLTKAGVSRAIRNLGRYAYNKNDLLLIVGFATADHMRQITELAVVNQYGSMDTTIRTGEVPRVYGCNVFETALMPETLNATGVVVSDGTLTEAVLVNVNYCIIGVPNIPDRQMSLTVVPDALAGGKYLLLREDIAFNMANTNAAVRILNLSTA